MRAYLRLSCALVALNVTVMLPWTAHAAVSTDIITAQPTANGPVTFTMKDTNSGAKVTATANILATDTPAQKATKLKNAANAAILADGLGLFDAAVAGNVVTVTKQGGGGMAITIDADKTGEGNGLRTKDSGGNGNNWFWRWVRSWVASSEVLPNGDSYAFDTTNGYSASVTGNGLATIDDLQLDITNDLISQGVMLVDSTGPSGELIQTSQWFAVGSLFPSGGVGLNTSEGYIGALGAMGIELVQVPVPAAIWLVVGALAGLLSFRRRAI